MSPEANKAIVRRLWEDVEPAQCRCLRRIFDAAYAAHEKRFMPRMLAAFPICFEVEDMIAEGDKVVTRYALIATHRGEFMGIPATVSRYTSRPSGSIGWKMVALWKVNAGARGIAWRCWNNSVCIRRPTVGRIGNPTSKVKPVVGLTTRPTTANRRLDW